MAADAASRLDELIGGNVPGSVVLFTQAGCPYCKRVQELLESADLGLSADKLAVHELPVSNNQMAAAKDSEDEDLEAGVQLRQALGLKAGKTSVPQLYIGGELIGGCDDTKEAALGPRLSELLKSCGAITATVDTAALVQAWPGSADWASASFCDAFLNGSNVPNSHGGGTPVFLGVLAATILAFILSTGLAQPDSWARWVPTMVMLAGVNPIQGVFNT